MKELIIWIISSISFGVIEAILFNYIKGLNTKFKSLIGFDIHYLFVVVRLAVLIPLALYTDEWFIFTLIAIFTFPFLHDGFYYQIRKLLSKGKIYPKGFISQSTTTTAKLSFNFGWRLIFFIFGAGMIFVLI